MPASLLRNRRRCQRVRSGGRTYFTSTKVLALLVQNLTGRLACFTSTKVLALLVQRPGMRGDMSRKNIVLEKNRLLTYELPRQA